MPWNLPCLLLSGFLGLGTQILKSYVLKYSEVICTKVFAHGIDNSLKQEDCPGQFIGLSSLLRRTYSLNLKLRQIARFSSNVISDGMLSAK